MLRVGQICAEGAKKYDARNWEKGIPLSEFMASAERHCQKWKRGDTDEDHLAMYAWNILGALHTEEECEAGRLPTELMDMPLYARRDKWVDLTGPQPPYRCGAIIMDEMASPKSSGNERGAATLGELRMEMSDSKPGTYYIAGPMRGVKQYNFPMFDATADHLKNCGYKVINPAQMDRDNGLDPVQRPGELEAYMKRPDAVHSVVERDIGAIQTLTKENGDGLCLLPGWQKSQGARMEVNLAIWLGLHFLEVYPDAHRRWGYGIVPRTVESIEQELFHQPKEPK